MAIEIVDFPMKNGGSFHSCVNVYQRVGSAESCDTESHRAARWDRWEEATDWMGP